MHIYRVIGDRCQMRAKANIGAIETTKAHHIWPNRNIWFASGKTDQIFTYRQGRPANH
jgi:hypothetical protein